MSFKGFLFTSLKIPVILFLLLLSSGNLKSQHVNYLAFDTEDGLPTSEVYSGFQAKNGLLWFASDRGVFTYNGYNFKIYTTNDGLGNNTVFNIFENEDASLWFTGYNGTITSYRDGKFAVHEAISAFVRKNYPSDWVSFCEFDKGSIIFSLNKHELLFEYSDQHRTIRRLAEFENLKAGQVIDIGRSKYIVNYPPQAGALLQYERYSRLIPLNGSQYVYGEGSTLYKIKQENGQWSLMDSIIFNASVGFKNICIVNEVSGELAISSDDGLYLCNFNLVRPEKNKISENENLTSIIRDKEGNYWATSLKKGVLGIPSLSIRNVADKSIHGQKFNSIVHFDNTLVTGSNTGDLIFINAKGTSQYFKELHKTIPIEQILIIDKNTIFASFYYRRTNAQPSVWFRSSRLSFTVMFELMVISFFPK